MKRIMMIIVLGALVACLVPANAQDWKSTSSMPVSGSTLAPQVTTVGATTVAQQATTTADYTPTSIGNKGIHRELGHGTDAGNQSEESPIGDAVLPLMVFAMLFGGYIAWRKRREA
jgi:ABC-type phosphate transport system substrate-binding protein